MRQNALWNCKNPNQGDIQKILCVCSAGLLRSATMATLLSQKGHNTRTVGVYDYALVQVDEVLLEWADVVLFAEKEHYNICKMNFSEYLERTDHHILAIPDQYQYMDVDLQEIINNRLKEHGY